MAQKTVIHHTSDLSGDEIDPGYGYPTVEFSLDGVSYEIDLTSAESDKLHKELEVWVRHARTVRSTRSRSTAPKRSTPGKSDLHPDPKAIRAWALENNITVPERGRIPASVREAYQNR